MYSVEQYLNLLALAGRSNKTIDLYRKTLKYYSQFLGIEISDLHNHLEYENLIKYAVSLKRMSPRGRTLSLSIIHRYYKVNKVEIPELETNVIKQRSPPENDDKPLTLKTLQAMMDIANMRERAVISMLVSTGMRAGELSNLRIEDIDGDTVTIPNEIAKGKRGGKVYLSSEAREYLDHWLQTREEYKKGAGNRHFTKEDYDNDDRLFCASYCSIKRFWVKLYDRIDGERGKYHAKCTLHSTRKYFRTNAVKTMSLDLVEKLMRHEGYLTGSYVRIPEEEARAQFHEGEHALYITRGDYRIKEREIEEMRQEHAKEMNKLNRKVALLEKILKVNE